MTNLHSSVDPIQVVIALFRGTRNHLVVTLIGVLRLGNIRDTISHMQSHQAMTKPV